MMSFSAEAQNYFILRASKDSLDGHMTFYDTQEKTIGVLLTIDPSLEIANHIFEYGLQPKSKSKSDQDLYNKIINIPYETFEYAVPINDTFIKSGNYSLIFRLKTKENQKLLQEKKINFQTLRNPNTFYQHRSRNNLLISQRVKSKSTEVDISKTFVNKYDAERLQKNIFALAPIADKAEQGALAGVVKSKKVNELRQYFYNFWQSRNPEDPKAAWIEYAEKLNYCSRKYAYGAFKGYQTDMGRMFLRFGAPNRIVKATNERGARSYEIWFYTEMDQFTNISILFSQIGTMANERVMLHSDEPSFYYNPNWASQLFLDPQERFNTTSHRVYDFFKP
jgi:GWxTD domain-containing protein